MPVAVRPSKLPRRKSPVNQWASSTSSGCRCEGTRAEFRAAKLQLLGSFANFIVPDLGLTNTEFGLLTGLFFIVFYSAMGLFMGALADMVNRTRLIAAGLALWSALTALSGAARGFWTLAAPRMLIGVGESIMTPTSMSLLSDRFPASKLGFASGFYYMGVPIGVGVSLLIAGYLGPAIGWRNCFYLLGGIGLALAAVMLFIKETPRRHMVVRADATVERPSFRQILRTLGFALRNCPALTLTIAGGHHHPLHSRRRHLRSALVRSGAGL